MKAPSAATAAAGTLKVKIVIPEKDLNAANLGGAAPLTTQEITALKGLNGATVTVTAKSGNAMKPPVNFSVKTSNGATIGKVLPRWLQDPNSAAPVVKAKAPAKKATTATQAAK